MNQSIELRSENKW